MNSDIYGDNYLNHYGIPGMKWGTRRSRASLRRSRKKNIKRMSNKQLQKAITRANLEKNYKATQVSAGKSFVTRSLATIGTAVAGHYTTKVIPPIVVSKINVAAAKSAKFAKVTVDATKTVLKNR